MPIENRIERIAGCVRILTQRLTNAGFEFAEPKEVFPGPQPGTDEAIVRIENEAGHLPLALKLFWKNIGSVNFCGAHPNWAVQPSAGWDDYTDPLVILPPSFSIFELDEFLEDKQERLRCHFPYSVIVAPDAKHKADVSGGAPYTITVPAVADDPPLDNEWHQTTLLNYLEEAIRWGGFPGLARCAGHNWPIEDLIKGF